MKLKVELLLRLLCAYEQDGIADFCYRYIKFYGNETTILDNLKKLIELGKIEKINKNGLYSRYKINEYLDCPEFLFDESIDIKYKVILLGLYKSYSQIKDFQITPEIIVEYTEISITTAKKYCLQYNINKDFEKLNVSPIKKSIFKSSEYLINTNEGIKYSKNKQLEYKCKYCGTKNPEDFYEYNHSTCKKCRHQRSYEQKKNAPLYIKLYRSSKHSKTHGKIEYNLTPEYIQQLLEEQNYKCFYTGVELKDSDSKFEKPTIDRIDSSKGYVKGNIVICTWVANNIKNDMTIDELYNQINLFKQKELEVKSFNSN